MKCFEDALTEKLSDFISLDVEYLNGKIVEIIYVYLAITDSAVMFNSFFKKNGRLISAYEISNSSERTSSFLEIGTDEIDELIDIYNKYQQTVPSEIKLEYQCSSNSLKAEFNYDTPFENEDFGFQEAFMQWYKSCVK